MRCSNCQGMKIVDPMLVDEAKKAFAELLTELIIFANENKLDHKKMPILTKVYRVIRVVEML